MKKEPNSNIDPVRLELMDLQLIKGEYAHKPLTTILEDLRLDDFNDPSDFIKGTKEFEYKVT